jgi:hypothetical protein
MISKIIDKGKTKLSLHRESKDQERHHLFTLPGNLPAHVANNHIGYKDDEVDNYVELPTSK